MKRVLIIGLAGSQPREIERHHGDDLDLRFASVDASPAHIKQQAQSAGLTIVMTRFVNHSHEILARQGAAVGGSHVVRVHGGMSSLRQALAAIRPPALRRSAAC
jgi:hypothetical protein